MQLHERFEPGCEAAFDKFLADGCPGGTRFEEVATTGEYTMVCRLPFSLKWGSDAVRMRPPPPPPPPPLVVVAEPPPLPTGLQVGAAEAAPEAQTAEILPAETLPAVATSAVTIPAAPVVQPQAVPTALPAVQVTQQPPALAAWPPPAAQAVATPAVHTVEPVALGDTSQLSASQ